jgi:xanthine dehydrogenase accessory factor
LTKGDIRMQDKKVLAKLMEFMENGLSLATVTIIKSEGSTPREIGATMLVDEQGNLLAGTIGGGVLEVRAIKDAVKFIQEKRSGVVDYSLGLPVESEEEVFLPAACGGKVSLFIKVYIPTEHLIIVGGGHVGQSIAKLAVYLGYSVSVLDSREEVLAPKLFPDGVNLVLGDMVESLKNMDIDQNTYIVIATYAHAHDERALEAVVESNARYIGMIGSRNKVKTCFENLLKRGYKEETLSKVYAPIGLDIGGETPEEIALSIMAEIQAVKYNRDAFHMKR